MITEIRIANFYSIGEEQAISFVKNGKLPEKGYTQIKSGESSVTNSSVSLINGFFGTNASGKTNVFRAITTLIAMMYNIPTPNTSPDISKNKNGIIRNFSTKYKDLPIKLGADFLLGDDLYSYDIDFQANGDILKEQLEVKQNQSKLGAAKKNVYTRNLEGVVTAGPSYKELEGYLQKSILAKNQNLFYLSMLQGFSFALNFRDKIFKWDLGISGTAPLVMGVINTALKLKHESNWLKNNALEITTSAVKLFDPTIESIDIQAKDQISIKFFHKGFDEPVDFSNESAGTLQLFTNIYQIIEILRKGGVVIYDEINRLWHPDIQKAIFNLFLRNVNENRSQLIFSSHDHEIMGDLELDQIYLVEKELGSSIVYKLSDVEGVQKRDNLSKKYRLGLYGATPDMIDFNYGLNELI